MMKFKRKTKQKVVKEGFEYKKFEYEVFKFDKFDIEEAQKMAFSTMELVNQINKAES